MGALRLVGHSAPGVPAADVTRPLALAARDGALKDQKGIKAWVKDARRLLDTRTQTLLFDKKPTSLKEFWKVQKSASTTE